MATPIAPTTLSEAKSANGGPTTLSEVRPWRTSGGPTAPAAAITDTGFMQAIIHGEARLSPHQALDLYHTMPLIELGRWADLRCRCLHGETVRTYVIDRNINYTNICTAHCTFCAFRRSTGADDAYTLGHDELLDKIGELAAAGGTQILMQGGMNPELPLNWYLDLLRLIKARFPHIHVHGFSPPEFIEFVSFFDPPGDCLRSKLLWMMTKMREAGLDSIPGGGGEIFAHPVRRRIGYEKCNAETWLTVMNVAHELGMFTSATMMFGHIEGIADRIHHMMLVRDWQDKAIADFARGTDHAPFGGRYKAFVSWPFQPGGTPLGRVPEWGRDANDYGDFPGDTGDLAHPLFGKRLRTAGSTEYLRTQAISRLILDNVYSIGASWVTMGPGIGQTALLFGANDLGSVMMEENVVSAAGTTYCMSEPVLCRLIRGAGFTPAQRDNEYNLLAVHDGPNSPDLRVTNWSTQRTAMVQHLDAEASATTEPSIGATSE
ncbi:MAG: radical SAM protein [Phycisphaerales bacterium]|nr:radical SAM protein [Phycisphaerales bacterium]